MDDDKDDNLIDPSIPSCWPSLDSDGAYFYGTDKDSSILSEFGWTNFPHPDFDRIIDPDHVQGSSSTVTASLSDNTTTTGQVSIQVNRSMSTSSSEDRPEISTASECGGGGENTTSETAGKVKKKVQKRIRQQRFAFRTKSEVDHLEDGYRWRKYGQKAVKHSPFPRSYYRCTNSKCTVKKRVERSSEDPSIVVTTYEGQHCHHTAGFPRGGLLINEAICANQLGPLASPIYHPRALFPQEYPLSINQRHEFSGEAKDNNSLAQQPQQPPQFRSDQGLLGDMVPPGMRNQ